MKKGFVIVSILFTSLINVSCVEDTEEFELQELKTEDNLNSYEINTLNIDKDSISINSNVESDDGDKEKWGNTKID